MRDDRDDSTHTPTADDLSALEPTTPETYTDSSGEDFWLVY